MPEVAKLKKKIEQLRAEKSYLRGKVNDILKDMDPKLSSTKRLSRLVNAGPITSVCLRCGKPLKSERSIAIGMGPSCHKKHIEGKQMPLRLVA